MSVVRVDRYHTSSKAGRQVMDALRSRGEPCFVLHLFHPSEDQVEVPRCPNCYDPVYTTTDTHKDCQVCYRTSFLGGVKTLYRTYGVFTDAPQDEVKGRRGEYQPDTRQVQLSGLVDVRENDVLIRVREYDREKGFLLHSPYTLRQVREITMRDGSKFGQLNRDRVGVTANLFEVDPTHPLRSWVPPQTIPFSNSWPIVEW